MVEAGSPETLSLALRDSAIDMAVLRRRYGAQLAIGRKVLGVEPNCHPYLEIWPAGLRSYNLLVPNLLNLPFLLVGAGPPKDTIGLVMYAASQAAGCAYCTAHSCTFALRRGADSQRINPAAKGSALDVARAIASVPATLSDEHRRALRADYSAADAEWIVLTIAMMGFLNKFMDAFGVPLENSMLVAAERVIGPTGWVPGRHAGGPPGEVEPPRAERLVDLAGIVRLLPALLYRDARWSAGAPGKWPAAGTYLRMRTGHDFPVLSRLTHVRAIRALTAIIAANTDPHTSELGLRAKYVAGRMYAETVADEGLASEMNSLAADASGDAPARPVLTLTEAASPSPAQVTADVVREATAGLSAAAVIELLVWLSVLQTLHRLRVYFG